MKLSKLKTGILSKAAKLSYISGNTYLKEKEWLYNNGYLRSRQIWKNGECYIATGQYEITEKGRQYVEATK